MSKKVVKAKDDKSSKKEDKKSKPLKDKAKAPPTKSSTPKKVESKSGSLKLKVSKVEESKVELSKKSSSKGPSSAPSLKTKVNKENIKSDLKKENSKGSSATGRSTESNQASSKNTELKVKSEIRTPSSKKQKMDSISKAASSLSNGPTVKKESVLKSEETKAHIEIMEESVSPSKKSKKIEASTEEEARWLELREKHRNTKALTYKMSEVYAEKTPIDHKVHGWGFILSAINDRLEVLFQSGIKYLISNYKSNT